MTLTVFGKEQSIVRIKRKTLILLLAAALLAALLSGCGAKTEIEKPDSGAEDFAGKKLGVVTGTVYEDAARKYFPEAEVCFYNSCADLAEALDKGKIDGYVLDEPVGRLTVQPYPDQHLSAMLEPAQYAFAFAKGEERSSILLRQFNAFVAESRQNGVLQEIDDIWFGTDESRKTISLNGLTGKNGTVRLATSTDIGAPFVYSKDGELVGYEVDLLTRFCREYGYALEMTDYNFAAILVAVTSGKDDVAACTLAITEERKESVNFSVPTYEGGVVVVTKTDAAENFAEQKLGVVSGTVFDAVAERLFPDAKITYFNSNNDMAEALESGRLDAYMLDEPMARVTAQSFRDQQLSPVLEEANYAYAFAKNSERSAQLCAELDAFIEESEKNGVLAEIDSIWFGTDESRKTVDYDRLTGENGTIRFAIATDAGGPFAYYKDGVLVGYEVDLLARFCLEKGYDLKITDYNFSALLSAVTGGKEDIAASAISVTGERQKIVDFSVPDYYGGIVTVTKTEAAEELPEDIPQKKLGVVAGTMHEDLARRLYPETEVLLYNNTTDLAKALDKGEIDFYLLDEPIGRLAAQHYADQYVSGVIEPASFAFAFAKGSGRGDFLRAQMDAFIEKSRENGVLQEVENIWLGENEERKTVSFDALTGENGTIRLAVSSDVGEPFVYIKNGALVGYEIDLLVRFCTEYGYDLEITTYSFASLLAALSNGMNDMAACAIAITEERQEIVNFSVPTYEGGIAVVTKDDSYLLPGFFPEQFSGKKVGIPTSSIFDSILLKHIPDAQPEYINAYADLAAALAAGKIDAYVADQPVARLMKNRYPDQVVALQLEDASYAFMFPKDEKHREICSQFDEFLEKCWADGTIAEIDSVWFGNDESGQTVDMSDLTAENGILEMAVSSDVGAPFAYMKNGRMIGYDVDMAVRFCREYGYGLHISDYNLAGLLAAASSGKADMAASSLNITPERKETALMSAPDYIGGVVLVAKNEARLTANSFSGKKVGIITGSVFDEALLKQVPDAQTEYINAYSDLAAALDAGKIDAYVADQPVARLMKNRYPDQAIAYQLEPASYAFMFPKDEKHQELCDQFNEFLAQCRADGTITEIDSVWFGDDESRQVVDMSDLTAENGVLEMAVSSDVGAPFTYIKDGQMVGYDIDVAVRFCREYGYGLHISDYAFAGILAAASSGKADMAASCIVTTPERQEMALMSEPDYIGGTVIVTRVGGSNAEQESFRDSMWDSFERTFLRENRWKLFLSGLSITFMITFISLILGSLGGFLVYRILRRGNKMFRGIWAFFASVMGRTPVVVILMILYYIIFGRSSLSSVWVSVIGFTALFICTVAELLKMGAGAVDNGQTEAARAMGYSARQTYLRIIFPQSIEHFLPAYKNEVITLVKATAIVGYIAVQDLTKISDLVRARTYEAFFPLIATAIIYYLLTLALTGLIRRINILTDPRRRSERKILRGVVRE